MRGILPGRSSFIESGRVRVFTQKNGRQRNVAFYREGDFFGELSILNGSQRAASVEAVADCRLLALQPESVREMKEQFPEFRKLLEERLAQYQADTVARVPLDFAEELLPAETRVQKVAIDEQQPPTKSKASSVRGTRGGIRRIPHVQQIDEMDCGAASLAMICRHFGRKVSLSHIRQLCHTSRDGTSLKAICHAAGELGLAARMLKVSPRNLPNSRCRRSCIGKATTGWSSTMWRIRMCGWLIPAAAARRISRAEFEAEMVGLHRVVRLYRGIRAGAGSKTNVRTVRAAASATPNDPPAGAAARGHRYASSSFSSQSSRRSSWIRWSSKTTRASSTWS